MGLTSRLTWPDGFQTLTTDRVKKGFSVVQIVAGLYPDMPPFDPREPTKPAFRERESGLKVEQMLLWFELCWSAWRDDRAATRSPDLDCSWGD